MNLQFSITELSNLTGKTRPTLYKYINAFESGSLSEIPYSFIQLFELMEKPDVERKEIVDYCEANFLAVDADMRINEIVSLIKNNKTEIDLDKLKKYIEEEIAK